MMNSEHGEAWLDIPGYEGWYQVSNKGRVKSLARTVVYGGKSTRSQAEKLLKLRAGGKPVGGVYYVSVILCRNRVRKQFKVHRLVAELFCPKPVGCEVVNHLDNNPANNSASNLEWTTVAGNNLHRHVQGRSCAPVGEANWNSVLTEKDVTAIKELLEQGELSQQEVADRFRITQSHVSKIHLGKAWAHHAA